MRRSVPHQPREKKAAEMRSRFATGDHRPAGDVWITSGPLFEWRLAGLSEGDENGLIGTPGWVEGPASDNGCLG